MSTGHVLSIVALFLFGMAIFLVLVDSNVLAFLAFAISLLLLAKARLSKSHESTGHWNYPSKPLRKQYGIPSVTMNGDSVKSIGEKTIADYLHTNGIRYQYEKAVKTPFGSWIAKADFYLVDYDVIVEYWGLVDVNDGKTNFEYEKRMRWKMAMYHKYRIKFISLYPSNLDNLDWIFRTKFKQVTGKDLEPLTNNR